MTARLVIRLDAGVVGLGHAVRVSGILAALGPAVEPVLVGEGQGLADFFPDLPLLPPGRPLSEICRDQRADALLIDLPVYPHGFFDDLRKISTPVICIDDVGGEIDADLIVNGTILDAYHRYPAARPGATKLLGGRYTLLRAAFAATPWTCPAAASLAIVIGSGERARDWAHWLLRPEVIDPDWGPVTLVVGSAFPDPGDLSRKADTIGVTLRQGLKAPEMADLLSTSPLCLITGGMIVYEALAVGVPAVVFPQLPNLIPEADWLGERGCIEDLGYDGGFQARTLRERVSHLLADPAARDAMSHRQRDLIDGRGTERAAAAIEALISGVKP